MDSYLATGLAAPCDYHPRAHLCQGQSGLFANSTDRASDQYNFVFHSLFDFLDCQVLSAVGCHTTLKAKPTLLDKVVFLADKIAWDQDGNPAYLSKIIEAMDKSLDTAVLEYLNYLWKRRSQLKVIHPWLVESREFLLQMNAR